MFKSLFRPNIQKLIEKKDTEGLIAALKVNDKDCILAAIQALGDLKAEASIDPLIEVWKSTDDKQIIQAIYACLGKLGTDKALKELERITDPGSAFIQDNPDVVLSIIPTLINLGDERAIKIIHKLCFGHSNSNVRAEIMYMIGDSEKAEFLPLLVSAMLDTDPQNTLAPSCEPFFDPVTRTMRSKFMRQAGVDGITKLGPQIYEKYSIAIRGRFSAPYHQIAHLHVLFSIGGKEGHEIIKRLAVRVDVDNSVKKAAQSLVDKMSS